MARVALQSKRSFAEDDNLSYDDVAHLTASSPIARPKLTYSSKSVAAHASLPPKQLSVAAGLGSGRVAASKPLDINQSRQEEKDDEDNDDEDEPETPLHPAPKRNRPENEGQKGVKGGAKSFAPTPSPRQRRVVRKLSLSYPPDIPFPLLPKTH